MSTTSIDVFNLAKTGGEFKGELPVDQLTRLRGDLTDTTGALVYRVSGETNTQKHPLLHIEIQGELQMTCQRCLEALQHTVNVDNTLHLVASEADLDSEEDELNAIIAGSDAPEKIVGSTDFDILDLLEDEVILSLPLTLVHDVCPTQLPTSSGQKASVFDILAKLK